MVISRRRFLAAVIGGAAAADPEWLAWVPGKQRIFIPPLVAPSAPSGLWVAYAPQHQLQFYLGPRKTVEIWPKPPTPAEYEAALRVFNGMMGRLTREELWTKVRA